MANVLSNNTSIKFANVPSTTGIYRYEVYVDSVLVFIGNTYLEANKTPIIDVTDIIKNYVDINKPPYSTSGEKSTIYKTISVTLYMDETESITETTQLFMIYENPFYNSKVTTNILDDFTTSSIGTMPMLQGWNYSNARGYFVPTYPTTASDVFTFDMVCGYQNLPMINNFTINYKNGLTDDPKYIQVLGRGIYQYSLPLSTLLRGANGSNFVYDTITDLFSFGTFAPYYRYEDSTITGTPTQLVRKYINTRYEDGNPTLPVERQYSQVFYTNGTNETVRFEVIGDIDGADNYFIKYEFNNILDISHIDVYISYDDGGEDILSIIPNVTNWTNINMFDNATDVVTIELEMKLDGGLPVNESITISTNKIELDVTADVCSAESITITAFSPVNSGQRYTYTIAKFDNKSRFFLKWQDRYGMPQCQSFGGTHKYNEKIDKTTTINYLNKSKIIDIISTHSWSLNTNWIQQEYFPYYESIFVSPWLQLYDAHEDKVYDVILVNNSYDEKTFKNQNKQLFNLQLDVELDTKQYMTY